MHHAAALHDAVLSYNNPSAWRLVMYLQSLVLQVLATTGIFAWGRGFMQQAKTELAPKSPPAGQDIATFAGGCFWGLELAFQREPGVTHTSVGYTQGAVEAPSYQAVCGGSTGHSEAVQVSIKLLFYSLDMTGNCIVKMHVYASALLDLPAISCRFTSIQRRPTLSAYWSFSLSGQTPQQRTGVTCSCLGWYSV
jgi:Peptide methionine sulfoxide reductase